MTQYNLSRFLEAQTDAYPQALSEIRSGRKTSHWMWYIFPQIAGLGSTQTARHYAIADLAEANAYAAHPVLAMRLIEISRELLKITSKSAHDILGAPDDLKLRSCMTLFAATDDADSVFLEVLQQFYDGKRDDKTLTLLEKQIKFNISLTATIFKHSSR